MLYSVQSRFASWIGVVVCLVFVQISFAAEQGAEPAKHGSAPGDNLLVNPGFEDGTGWTLIGSGAQWDAKVAHQGGRSLRCSNTASDETSGAKQVIVFDTPVQHSIRISGWSRAEHIDAVDDYDIFVDAHYADGTPLWGQIARFNPESTDWHRVEYTFQPVKPLKSLDVYVFLRKAKGTAWFDDLKIERTPLEISGFKVFPNVYGTMSLSVVGQTSLPSEWNAVIKGPSGVLAQSQGNSSPILLEWVAPESAPAGKYAAHLTVKDPSSGATCHAEREFDLAPTGVQRNFAVWTESSMRHVLPSAMPPLRSVEKPQAEIQLAGREYESFQILLRSGVEQPIREVSVIPSDLVCKTSGAKIAAANITWHEVGYVRVDKLRGHPADPDALPGWWPDALLPVDKMDILPQFTQSIWVTVLAPAGTPAGDYRGTISLQPKGKPAIEIGVCAKVYGFDLPVRSHLKTTFALMDGYLERLYGKPLSDEMRRKYGDFVLQHRLNPDDISRTSPPAIEDLRHYKDRLNTFNIMNLVEPRGDKTWVCYSEKPIYTEEFKKQLIARLDPAVEEIRKEGLEHLAYIHGFDEREKDFYPIFREFFGLVKQRYPKIPTLTTGRFPLEPDVLRDLKVDWACPLTPGYQYEAAEKCRQAGFQVWAYVCLGPGYPYANWLADHPLIESRVFWWQAYQQKMDGILYWGLNIWDRKNNEHRIHPEKGPLLDFSITTGGPEWPEYDKLHGDGVLLYPGDKGPIGSIRLANLRDGLEDYEYLWLLAEKLKNVEQARRACLPVTESLTRFTRDPEKVVSQRDAIARQLP